MSDTPAAEPASPATPAPTPPEPQPAPAPPAPPLTDPAKTHEVIAWKYATQLWKCRFDPLGRFLFTTGQDSFVVRWDLATGQQTPLGGHDTWVQAIAFSPDGQTLVTGGADGRLVWRTVAGEKPEPARIVDAHAGWVRAVAVSPKGDLVASGGNDQLVKLWNLSDGQLVRTFTGHPSNVYSLLFHPSGEFLLSGDLFGNVNQWEAAMGKLVRSFDAKELYSEKKKFSITYGGVLGMALSADASQLACCGLHKTTNALGAVTFPAALVFDWGSQKVLQTHVAAKDLKGTAYRVAYHRDGYWLGATGGVDGGSLLFWKPSQAEEFFKFALPSTAHDFDLHPDGQRVATVHADSHARIFLLAEKPAG